VGLARATDLCHIYPRSVTLLHIAVPDAGWSTTLPTNSLLTKSIQIHTVASRFLTARHHSASYLSNNDVRLAGTLCVSERTNPQGSVVGKGRDRMKRSFVVAASSVVLRHRLFMVKARASPDSGW